MSDFGLASFQGASTVGTDMMENTVGTAYYMGERARLDMLDMWDIVECRVSSVEYNYCGVLLCNYSSATNPV